jgi:sensor c-di-GMP phosphodiesterase-like protein
VTSSGSESGRDAIEAELRAALRAGEIEVHYQPNVDAVESEVIGFEALVR